MRAKNKLTERQWANIERAILKDGESMNAMAKKYGIDESTVRHRVTKLKTEQVEEAAIKLAEGERAIRALKPIERVRARSLADMYIDLSYTLGEAASIGADVHLKMIKKASDIAETMGGEPSKDDVKMVMALSSTANSASKLAVDLMNVGKQTMHDAEKAKDKDKEVMTMAPINIPSFQKS
jgi:hypothetical protein